MCGGQLRRVRDTLQETYINIPMSQYCSLTVDYTHTTSMARFLPALLALPLVGAIPAPAPMPMPTPPGIPSAATAQNQLAGLTVAAQGSSDGYDRDLFPHWDSQGK